MNYSQQDELAQLFAQNMFVSGHAPVQAVPQPVQQLQQQEPAAEPSFQHDMKTQQSTYVPIHYASTHYTPTAHIHLSDVQSEPSRSPPPSYVEAILPASMADILRQNSIDPAALSPNQVQLFANAEYEQRLRLLELWRIAPPSYPQDSDRITPTSVEKEELAAKFRYEAQMEAPRTMAESIMVESAAMSPIRAAHEPAWPPAARLRAASIAAGVSQATLMGAGEAAEPYILAGYDQQPQQLSSAAAEPVYAATSGLWQATHLAQAQQMESQYYESIRNHADWERMNEAYMSERLGHGVSHDEDMVM